MPYVVIEDFRFGLDTRRHPLVSPPGTLQDANNVHINRGGEVEKRKPLSPAWGSSISVSSITNPGGTGTVTFTVTTSTNHGLTTRDWISIRGADDPRLDVETLPTVTGPTTFTFQLTSVPVTIASPASGTIVVLPFEQAPSVLNDAGDTWISLAHGLESTDSGLVVFGSCDSEAPRFEELVRMKSGLTYQKLTNPAIRTVSSITRSSGTATVTFSKDHNLAVGDLIDIFGAVETDYNGTYEVATAPNGSQITYNVSNTPSSPATGTITSASAMTKARWSTTFNGKAFCIAEFDDGDVYCYHNGTLVNDSFYGRVNNTMTSINDLAENLKVHINLDTATHGYMATRSGAVVTITGPDANTFTVTGSTVNNGATADEDIAIAVNTNGTQATTATSATAQIWILKGSGQSGAPTALDSLRADGVEILTGSVSFNTEVSQTATDIASDINSGTGTHGYTAAASGAKITVTAPAGTEYNNVPLEWTIGTGEMQFGTSADDIQPEQSGQVLFDGAEATVTEVKHKVDATFSGTLEVGDLYALTLTEEDGTIYRWGYTRITGQDLTTAVALKTKMYMAAGGNVFYSKIDDPTVWQEGSNESSGVINMLNEYIGSEEVKGLGVYENNLAVFGKNAGFIWFVDPDAASNRLLQVLPNLGAIAPGGVATYGDRDVFFLSRSGLRSLRVRDSSGNAAVNDVGVQIDNEIITEIDARTTAQLEDYVTSAVEPETGRFWVSFPEIDGEGRSDDDAIFVYSRFPGSEISAWTKYRSWIRAKFNGGLLASNISSQVRKLVTHDGKIYALVYSGFFSASATGPLIVLQYDPDSSYQDNNLGSDITLPWLDMGKPAHEKQLLGVDIVASGDWTLACDMDPTSGDTFETLASFTQSTAQLGRIPVRGISSHFRFRLSNTSGGDAKIANFIVHYKDRRED